LRAGKREFLEKKEVVMVHGSNAIEEMEGALRATGIPSIGRVAGQVDLAVVPNSEVPEKASRRRFTAEYKRRILREAESCREQGGVGALLRREGLYSSHLITWRRQAERGTLEALSPKKRGPKKKPDPSLRRIAELEKATRKLEHKLRQAELIIAAQKKIAEIFQMSLDPKDEKNS
jgi:transposase-like protein